MSIPPIENHHQPVLNASNEIKTQTWLGRCFTLLSNAGKRLIYPIRRIYEITKKFLFPPSQHQKQIPQLSSSKPLKNTQKQLEEPIKTKPQSDDQCAKDEEYAKRLQAQFIAQQKKTDLDNFDAEYEDEEISRLLEKEFYAKAAGKTQKQVAVKEPLKIANKQPVNLVQKAIIPTKAEPSIPSLTADEMKKMKKIEKATQQILGTNGLVSKGSYYDLDDDWLSIAASLTKDLPDAISPAALRANRLVNFEQYLFLKIKQFCQVEEVGGKIALPSGKLIVLDDFFEELAVPIVISSFNSFSKSSNLFKEKDREWIKSELNKINFCDFISKKEIEEVVTKLNDPSFAGPIIIETGYIGHCAAIMFVGDYVLYADREEAVYSGTTVFHLPNRALITDDFISALINRCSVKREDYHLMENIMCDLGATHVHHELAPILKAGNGTHATMNTVLQDLMAIRELLNTHWNLNGISASDWAAAFSKIKSEHTKCSLAERQAIFDDMINEIEEWVYQKTDIASQKLKKTYQQLLQCWLNTPDTVREPSEIKKVEGLLDQLMHV